MARKKASISVLAAAMISAGVAVGQQASQAHIGQLKLEQLLMDAGQPTAGLVRSNVRNFDQASPSIEGKPRKVHASPITIPSFAEFLLTPAFDTAEVDFQSAREAMDSVTKKAAENGNAVFLPNNKSMEAKAEGYTDDVTRNPSVYPHDATLLPEGISMFGTVTSLPSSTAVSSYLAQNYFEFVSPLQSASQNKLGFSQQSLDRIYRQAALISSAKEFGELIPESHRILRKKIQDSLNTIGEEATNDKATLEKLIFFSNDLTDYLQKIYAEDAKYDSVALKGIQLNTRVLGVALDAHIPEEEKTRSAGFPLELTLLISILQALNTLFEFAKNVRGGKEGDAPAKTMQKGKAKPPNAGATIQLSPREAEAIKTHMFNLELEYCKVIEGYTDKSISYGNAHQQYREKACGYIKDIKKTHAGKLPDIPEVIECWENLGCRNFRPAKKTEPDKLPPLDLPMRSDY